MVLVGILSLMPLDDIDLGGPDIPYFDKWVHMSFYLLGMVLGSLFLRERYRNKIKRFPSLIWMGALLFFYGMIIEAFQGMSGFNRNAEWWDLAANGLGILLGGVFAVFLFRKKQSLKWRD